MWHFVYFENGKKGVRLFPTNLAIREDFLSPTDWQRLLISIGLKEEMQ